MPSRSPTRIFGEVPRPVLAKALLPVEHDLKGANLSLGSLVSGPKERFGSWEVRARLEVKIALVFPAILEDDLGVIRAFEGVAVATPQSTDELHALGKRNLKVHHAASEQLLNALKSFEGPNLVIAKRPRRLSAPVALVPDCPVIEVDGAEDRNMNLALMAIVTATLESTSQADLDARVVVPVVNDAGDSRLEDRIILEAVREDNVADNQLVVV